jgi:predicted nucleotidyltransferase component of viral defense system
MKELIKTKLHGLKSREEKYNFLREFLQELVLQILDRHHYFKNLAFVGGTALRIIYDLPRFSEDLDFSLINKKDFDFDKMLARLEKDLSLNGLEVEIAKATTRTVFSSFVKFKGILYELGLTPHAKENLFIKIEIDSNPPAGYATEVKLINKNFLFKVLSYDLPSLFASKLHAFLFRKYAKGRDYYDLLWFLTRKTKVNFELLNTAAHQTEKKNFDINPANLQTLLNDKIDRTNLTHIQKELLPFLADKHEIEFFQAEYLKQAINTI